MYKMIFEFEDFLKYIKRQNYYHNQIKDVESIPAEPPKYGKLEKPLNKRLETWMKSNHLKLWTHQSNAINLIREGYNTVISTSTASGKSLCYNLSVVNSVLDDERTTALYIFPTKALSRDQYYNLLQLMSDTGINGERVGIYDGDMESHEKRQVLDKSNIIITNPYGLHFYLPWFTKKWGRICKNLKYVILDEVHIYRGVFGSNFALLIRRLKRILDSFGVQPCWILSSATINNPKRLAENLIGEDFKVVDKDGSPAGEKKVILWDLPYDEISGKYRSPHQETKSLFVSHLEYGIQTLVFTLSRKMAELQAMWTRKALPHLRNKIYSYRAGINKKSRREIEKNFKLNKILGISSTNALELGIDIGSLDATICSGFPGTISSFKQQIGRSGRGEITSISTFIPMQNPLDFFYIHNPEILFGPIKEEVLITLKNKYILKNHLCCASKEKALLETEYEKFGIRDPQIYLSYLEELREAGLLMKRGIRFFWKGGFYPNQEFRLTNLSDRIYKVILISNNKESLLTTEDESYVFRDLHPGAVYLYEAESYLVVDLDLMERKVYLKKTDVDFYTQSLKHTEISVIDVEDTKCLGKGKNIESCFGNVKVRHEYYSYKIIDTLTQETRSRQPLEDLPIIEFETQSMWFFIPFEFQKELELEGFDLGGTIHAIEHGMIAMAPALAQISRWDLGGVSIDFDPVKQQPIIYIYDAFRGGIGISESLYYELKDLLTLTHSLISSCSCNSSDGCPACIMSSRCGNRNEPLDKKGALFLLEKLINAI